MLVVSRVAPVSCDSARMNAVRSGGSTAEHFATLAIWIVAHVHRDDLARTTPCVGWDLRASLTHMTGQNDGFAARSKMANRVSSRVVLLRSCG